MIDYLFQVSFSCLDVNFHTVGRFVDCPKFVCSCLKWSVKLLPWHRLPVQWRKWKWQTRVRLKKVFAHITVSPLFLHLTLSRLSQTYENKQGNQKVTFGSSRKVSQSSLNCQSRANPPSKQGVLGSPPVWVKQSGGREGQWVERRAGRKPVQACLSVCFCVCVCARASVFYSCFYSWQGQGVILWLRLFPHLLFSFTYSLDVSFVSLTPTNKEKQREPEPD